MQKITPHLWFDKEAREAAEFYTSLLPDSKVTNVTTITGTPSGDCDIVSFTLAGQSFMAISAGPVFTFNPSISFFICCETKEEVDALWAKLSDGGTVLMEIGAYPFSERYGWVQDRWGLSWQIMYMGGQAFQQKIIPALTFVGDVCGKVEEAMNFYTSVFSARGGGDTKVNYVMKYGAGETPDKEGTIKHAGFVLAGMQFAAMDSAYEHKFAFNEAVSFIVHCDTQDEIDYFWGKLSAVPASEQCGWLKDKYGISWQIVPTAMDEMMIKGTKDQIVRVTRAFLQMKKFDIAELQKAYEQS